MQHHQPAILGGSQTVTGQIMPRGPIEIHAESDIGTAILKLGAQLKEMSVSISTLRDRMYPVLMPTPQAAGICSQGNTPAEMRSPIHSDLHQLSMAIDENQRAIFDILHNLSI